MKTLFNKTFLIAILMITSAVFSSFATESMYIDANGNVGIGTNTPSAKLDVDGYINMIGASQLSGDVQGKKFFVGSFNDPTGNYYGFSTPNCHHLAIDANTGNVGIGRVSPQEKLHIAGNLKVDGHIKLTGQIYSASGTYFLGIQDDGNLIMYRASDNKPIWSWMTGKIN